MLFVTAILDFIYTIYQDVRGDAAKFQYLTPIVIAASMVSLTESIKYKYRSLCNVYVLKHYRVFRGWYNNYSRLYMGMGTS